MAWRYLKARDPNYFTVTHGIDDFKLHCLALHLGHSEGTMPTRAEVCHFVLAAVDAALDEVLDEIDQSFSDVEEMWVADEGETDYPSPDPVDPPDLSHYSY